MNKLIAEHIDEKYHATAEENNRLAVLAQKGDETAKEKLILNYAKMIEKLVNRYKTDGNDVDDLFQEGVCGILKAIKTYDPERSSFSTHSFTWIRAMILKYMMEREKFHYDSTFYNKKIRYNKLKEAVGREEDVFTPEELIDYNLTEKDVKQVLKYSRQSYSLESISEGDGTYSRSNDKICDPNEMTEEKVFEKEMKNIVSREIERLLTDKELFVIRNLYGIGNEERYKTPKIAEMMAKHYGLQKFSRQRVQQIRKKAESKLQESELLHEIFTS